MRTARVSVLALLLGASALLAAEPAPMPRPVEQPVVTLPDGRTVRTVDPGQMKFRSVRERFSLPAGDTKALKDVKPPPPEFDFGKMKDGRAISFPMLGNDRWGDCFYVAPAHQHQCWWGMTKGQQLDFNEAQLVARYRRLSPRDTGLGDDQVVPEWKAGIIGPAGPHKILDCATIDPADWASVKTACYYLGGLVTTHTLRTTWMSPRPGAVWDKTGWINPRAGHAVQETGVRMVQGQECLQVNTWGMQVYMTQAGLANSNAEVLCSISTEWFDRRGFSPTGVHYNEVARVWKAGTGRELPAGLFPDPTPTPPPAPPVPPPAPPAPPTPPKPPVPVAPPAIEATDGVYMAVVKVTNLRPADFVFFDVSPEPAETAEFDGGATLVFSGPAAAYTVKARGVAGGKRFSLRKAVALGGTPKPPVPPTPPGK